MLLGRKNPTRIRIILLLLASLIAYSISNIASYLVAVAVPAGLTMISTRLGFLACALIILAYELKGRKKSVLKIDKTSIVYGLAMGITGIILFTAYQSFTLSSIFPLIGGSSLMFLALDFVLRGREIRRKEAAILIVGVLIIVVGTFFTQSIGFTFNLASLPYVIGLIVSTGIGYYALLYRTKESGESPKFIAFSVIGLALGATVAATTGVTTTSLMAFSQMLPLGFVSGFALCVAFVTEIMATKLSLSYESKKDVAIRNFINNFTELDTVVVLIASVFIGSFTYESIFGGLLMVVGIIILGFIV